MCLCDNIQNNGKIGLYINGVKFSNGVYDFVTTITTTENIYLSITENNHEKKFKIKLKENIARFSVTHDANYNIGLFFAEPHKNAKFLLYKFQIIKIENIIQNNIIDIHDVIKHVYLINSDSQKDNLFRSNRYLKRMGFAYERINKHVSKFEDLKNVVSVPTSIINKSEVITQSELGRLDDHIDIFRDAIKNKYEVIMIFEDNFIPHKKFNSKLQKIFDQNSDKWDIIDLSNDDSINNENYNCIVKYCIYESVLTKLEKYEKNSKHIFNELISGCRSLKIGLTISDQITTNTKDYFNDVSIIIPVCESGNMISECLDSIRQQKTKSFEIIIVDSDATGNTLKIVEKFSEDNIGLDIFYISLRTESKLSRIINVGLKHAHGRYAMWIMPNDRFINNAIEKMTDFLNINKQSLIVESGYKILSEDYLDKSIFSVGETKVNEFYLDSTQNSVFHNFMFKTDVIKEIGYLNDGENFDNKDYALQILNLPPYKSGIINDILLEQHVHQINILNIEREKRGKREKREKIEKGVRETNDIIYSYETLKKNIKPYKDIFIYISSKKYNNEFDRHIQILKNMCYYYNCVYTSIINCEICIKNDIIICSYNDVKKILDNNSAGKTFIYFSDPELQKYVNDIKHIVSVFDLTIGDINTSEIKTAIDSSDIIIYSSNTLLKTIKNVDKQKRCVYIPNACNDELTNLSKNIDDVLKKYVNIIDNIKKDNKKIVGYFGGIDNMIDYDLVNEIATMKNLTIVIIECSNGESQCKHYLTSNNIILIENQPFENISSLSKYFDICLIPFKTIVKQHTLNPLQMSYYMKLSKPIISTITMDDTTENDYFIVGTQNCKDVINKIIINNVENIQYKFPKWEDLCKRMYRDLLQFKRTYKQEKTHTCVIVVNVICNDENNAMQQMYIDYMVALAKLLTNNNIYVIFYEINTHIGIAEKHEEIIKDFYGFEMYCSSSLALTNEMISNSDYDYDYVIYGDPILCCLGNTIKGSICINFDIHNNVSNDNAYLDRLVFCAFSNNESANVARKCKTSNISKIKYISPFLMRNDNLIEIQNYDKEFNIIIPKCTNLVRDINMMFDILKLINRNVKIKFSWIRDNNDDNEKLKMIEKIDDRFCMQDKVEKFNYDAVLIPTNTYNKSIMYMCMKMIEKCCIIIAPNICETNNILLNNHNCFLTNPDAYEIADVIIKLKNDPKMGCRLKRNISETISDLSIDNWNNMWEKQLTNIGWIDKIDDDKNDMVMVNRKMLDETFSQYWKNYVNYYEIPEIKNYNNAYDHFKKNALCVGLLQNKRDIKIGMFIGSLCDDNIVNMIAEESKYMNIDVYVVKKDLKRNKKFLFNYVENVSDVNKIMHDYNIIFYYDIPKFILEIIEVSNIPSIEYYNGETNCQRQEALKSHCDYVITYSRFHLCEYYLKFGKQCQIVEYPVDVSKYVGSNDDKKWIGCVCSYNKECGIEILLHAIYDIKHNLNNNIFDDYKIVIFGNGDIKYKKELERLAKELDLNCEFFYNVCIDDYLDKFRLLIVHFQCHDGLMINNELPISLLKALSCDIQVIAPKTGCIKEFYYSACYRGYENLFQMCDIGNVNELSQQIYETLNVPLECSKKHEYIEKYYSSQNHCNKLIKICENYVSTEK